MKRLEITTMLVKIDSIIISNNKTIELLEQSIKACHLRAELYDSNETKNIDDFTHQKNEFIELNVEQEKLYRNLVVSLEMKCRPKFGQI